MNLEFDVIIVGGGHAGVEAASASARAGASTALITHKASTIGEMSCNPAIGGLGKGHLVREIDALGGIMGQAADQGGIQFRLLNRSKGPAVQGPRTQADRKLYRNAVQKAVAAQDNLTVIEDGIDDLLFADNKLSGVIGETGKAYRSGAVVLTTGTFLDGIIHRGDERIPAGRVGDQPAKELSKRLYSLDLEMGRLKTGTPARLKKSSIDWSVLEMQPADAEPIPFSFLTDEIEVPQIECGMTYTNEETHKVINENIEQSAVYSGAISGKGPRYCPSIEDKVTRFADKNQHQVFLEPEGLDDDLVYPNGISTSLPAEVQDKFLRTMKGLENVEIAQYGYAIEYDYVDPRELTSDLQLKKVPSLYLAGQINGTTGYEEAGAQGLIAGVNAARKVQGLDAVTLDRSQAYIGVMIDDLVTRGVSEPYRMFTSRAEYRLSLRSDNADQRLTPLGDEWNIISEERQSAFSEKLKDLSKGRELLQSLSMTPNEAGAVGIKITQDGRRRTAYEILAFPHVDYELLTKKWPELETLGVTVKEQLAIEAIYAGYLERQQADIESFRKDERLRLPLDIDYASVGGLSNEVRSKLEDVRPSTLGQASRIEGVTPGAITALLAYVKRSQKVAARQ